MPVLRKAQQLYEILIHVNEVIWHEENGGKTLNFTSMLYSEDGDR